MGIEQRGNVEGITTKRKLDNSETESFQGYRITNPDGSTTTVVRFEAARAYMIYGKFSGNANDFFQDVLEVTNELGRTSLAEPKKRDYNNFYYGFYGQEGIQISMDNFTPQPSLDNTDELAIARLDTGFGTFSLERFTKTSEIDEGIATHLTAPEALADLFIKHSADQVDKEALIEVLTEVGTAISHLPTLQK